VAVLNEDIFKQFPLLETPRLRLREIVSADSHALYRIFSDPDVCRYYDLDQLTDVSQAEEMVTHFAERFANCISLRWAITRKPFDDLIGTFGLFVDSDWRGAIGYDLHPDYWRQGIMTEAVTELTRFGFEDAGLPRIEAFVMLDNIASVRLLEKIGYTEEGVLRQYMFFKGQLHDMRCFSRLAVEH
jgi:ribosomal-protein-alanine N-acetyltransferase